MPRAVRERADAVPLHSSRHATTTTGRVAVEEVLTRLGRALHHLHAYPEGSPSCVEAVGSCHRALLALDRESLAAEVITEGLRVEGDAAGASGPIERELAKRLRIAGVASLEIRCDITLRSLTRFCEALVAEQVPDGRKGLDRRLVDLDVQGIAVRIAAAPEVLAVNASVEGLQ